MSVKKRNNFKHGKLRGLHFFRGVGGGGLFLYFLGRATTIVFSLNLAQAFSQSPVQILASENYEVLTDKECPSMLPK